MRHDANGIDKPSFSPSLTIVRELHVFIKFLFSNDQCEKYENGLDI